MCQDQVAIVIWLYTAGDEKKAFDFIARYHRSDTIRPMF